MALTNRKLKSPVPQNLNNSPGGETRRKNGVPVFGWYKMADDWWEHLPRLQRGLYQRMLIEFVWASTVPREDGAVLPEWSRPLSWSEMAARFRCSPAQLHDDARDAHERGLIEIKGYKGGRFENRGEAQIRILWQRWGDIKDYTPPKPQLVEKKQPKISAHWFGKDRDIEPGESWQYSVTDLPADFQLQGFVFKNTGESGSVTIAGGGPAEDGLIVLETKARISDPIESRTSAKETGAHSRKEAPKKRESTPQTANPKIAFSSPLAKTLAGFGILSSISVNKLVADCQACAPECSLEEIEQAARMIGDRAATSPNSRNVAGIVLKAVPDCFVTGTFRAPRVTGGASSETSCPFCQCDRVNSMGICAACGQSREVAKRRAEQRKRA